MKMETSATALFAHFQTENELYMFRRQFLSKITHRLVRLSEQLNLENASQVKLSQIKRGAT